MPTIPEHVYVENDWYDGPRSGVANLNGQPHRFVSQFDETEDEYLGTFLLWPIDEAELALEQEQYQIFVKWNELYEAGKAEIDSHPGQPSVSKRWKEIDSMLESRRTQVPGNARRAKAQVMPLERPERYALSGPAYQLSWKIL